MSLTAVASLRLRSKILSSRRLSSQALMKRKVVSSSWDMVPRSAISASFVRRRKKSSEFFALLLYDLEEVDPSVEDWV